MAELLDRDTQRALLERLHGHYPRPVGPREFVGIAGDVAVAVNIAYLAEHGLVEASIRAGGFSGETSLASAKITARGIDFLADDGGLSAILGLVTVKLHSETIRDLLIARVRDSEEPITVKARLIDQLKATPAQALGQLTERALDAGLQAIPNFADWLQRQI